MCTLLCLYSILCAHERNQCWAVKFVIGYFPSLVSLSKPNHGVESSSHTLAHEEIVASLKSRIFQLEDEVCWTLVFVVFILK